VDLARAVGADEQIDLEGVVRRGILLRPVVSRHQPCMRQRAAQARASTDPGEHSGASGTQNCAVPRISVLDHRDLEVASRIVALQRVSYSVEAELIGFRIPVLDESAVDVARLDLTVLGAVESGELVGLLGYRQARGVVDIDRLAVHPRCFRQGVARSLLAELHRREPGAHRFEVSTGADNVPALALYARMGYRHERDEWKVGVRVVHLARP
jgi:GNAT superfamily N-acetyltransferase